MAKVPLLGDVKLVVCVLVLSRLNGLYAMYKVHFLKNVLNKIKIVPKFAKTIPSIQSGTEGLFFSKFWDELIFQSIYVIKKQILVLKASHAF